MALNFNISDYKPKGDPNNIDFDIDKYKPKKLKGEPTRATTEESITRKPETTNKYRTITGEEITLPIESQQEPMGAVQEQANKVIQEQIKKQQETPYITGTNIPQFEQPSDVLAPRAPMATFIPEKLPSATLQDYLAPGTSPYFTEELKKFFEPIIQKGMSLKPPSLSPEDNLYNLLQTGNILGSAVSTPFTLADILARGNDYTRPLADIVGAPFQLAGRVGEVTTGALIDLGKDLGVELKPETEQALTELGSLTAQFILPAKFMSKFKGRVEGKPPLEQAKILKEEIIPEVKQEFQPEQFTTDIEGKTKNIETGETVGTQPYGEQTRVQRKERAPLITEKAPEPTGEQRQLFGKERTEPRQDLIDERIRERYKKEKLEQEQKAQFKEEKKIEKSEFKEKVLPKIDNLLNEVEDIEGFNRKLKQYEFALREDENGRPIRTSPEYINAQLEKYGIANNIEEYFNLKKEVKTVSPIDEYVSQLPETKPEDITRAQKFIQTKKDLNLNYNSVDTKFKLSTAEIIKGQNDILKGDVTTKEAKLVLDKINNAFEKGITGNGTRQDPRQSYMKPEELKQMVGKETTTVYHGEGIERTTDYPLGKYYTDKKHIAEKFGNTETKEIDNSKILDITNLNTVGEMLDATGGYLDINPYSSTQKNTTVKYLGSQWNILEQMGRSKDFIKNLQDKGYEGIKFIDKTGAERHNSFVVFSDDAFIKSKQSSKSLKPTGQKPVEKEELTPAWQMTSEEWGKVPQEIKEKYPVEKGYPRADYHPNYWAYEIQRAITEGKELPKKVLEEIEGTSLEGHLNWVAGKKIIKEALGKQSLDFMGLSKLSDITKPEVLKAVKDIAKYHIQNGINKFSDFARAMVKDTGGWIKKHLRSLWEEVKAYATGEKSLVGEGLSMNFPIPREKFDKGGAAETKIEFFKRRSKEVPFEQVRKEWEQLQKPETKPVEQKAEQKPETVKSIQPQLKQRIKMGEKESEFEYNPKTVHKEIETEIADYVKNNIDVVKELRRQRITDKQAIARATELAGKLTDKDIYKIKAGDTFPIEEHLGIVGYASKRVKEIINDPKATDIDKSNGFLMFAKSEAIGGELGRSLRGRQLIPKLSLDEIKSLTKDLPKEFVEEANKLLENYKKENEPNALDYIRYYFYNAMLSRPVTHMRNIVGNVSHLSYEAILSAFQSPTAVIKGLYNGVKNVPKDFKRIWKEGGDISKFTEGRRYEPKNKIIRNSMPTTWLKLEDVFFKELAKGIETELQVKQLSKEFKGEDARQMIKDVLDGKELETLEKQQRFEKAIDEIKNFSEYVTFQNELGRIGQWLQKGTHWFFPVMPFVRTPVNILKVGMKPLGILKFTSKEYKAKFRDMSPVEKKHELSRIIAGSVMFSTIATMVMNGELEVTGEGADDKSKKDFMEKQGWRPNSVKLGNNYYSYQNLNPINILFGLLGNYSDGLKYNFKPKDDELSGIQKVSKALGGFVQTFTDQSFLSGLNNLFKWKEKQDPYYLEQFLQTPVPGLFSIPKDYKTYVKGETTAYETKGFSEKLKNRLGITEGLRPKLNIFGEEEQTTYETLPIPYKAKYDELSDMFLKNNVTISYPSRNILKPNGEALTDDEYFEFFKKQGEEIKKTLLASETFNELKKLTAEEMDKEVGHLTTQIREDIREELFGKKERKEKYQYKLKYKKAS